ncbi:hypothetical protein TruAng_001572 [Truncatella angustata]|nr:hypothetical protein TruAng_001572 [Truncatella angustata]
MDALLAIAHGMFDCMSGERFSAYHHKIIYDVVSLTRCYRMTSLPQPFAVEWVLARRDYARSLARDCTAGDDDLCWERFLFIAWELGDAGWAKELIMMLAMSDTSKPLYFLQFDSITDIDTQDDCNTYRKGQFAEQFWNHGWTSIPTTEEWRGDPITLLLELSASVPKPIKSHKGYAEKKTRNDFELEMWHELSIVEVMLSEAKTSDLDMQAKVLNLETSYIWGRGQRKFTDEHVLGEEIWS